MINFEKMKPETILLEPRIYFDDCVIAYDDQNGRVTYCFLKMVVMMMDEWNFNWLESIEFLEFNTIPTCEYLENGPDISYENYENGGDHELH